MNIVVRISRLVLSPHELLWLKVLTNLTLINFGSFLSTTISSTQDGTVSFKRTPSVSPPASLASSLYNVLPPTCESHSRIKTIF